MSDGMVDGVRYIVTKGSEDGSFEVGDHVHLDTKGCIICREAGAWIDADEAHDATLGWCIEVDTEYAKLKEARLLGELNSLLRPRL